MSNELIKRWESFRAEPYKDSVGIPTIGYGTTHYPNGLQVTMSDPPITEPQAYEMVEDHLMKHVRPFLKLVTIPLNLNQKQALESFIYNLGGETFKKSTLLQRLNKDDFEGTALEFMKFIKAGGKILPGLISRRADEMVTFLRPSYRNPTPIQEESVGFLKGLISWLKK